MEIEVARTVGNKIVVVRFFWIKCRIYGINSGGAERSGGKPLNGRKLIVRLGVVSAVILFETVSVKQSWGGT